MSNEVQKVMQEIKERKQLYQNVFESPDGKRVLEDLSRHAFIRKTTFSENPQRTAFNEGQRSMVLHIQSMMAVDLERTKKLLEKQQGGNDE